MDLSQEPGFTNLEAVPGIVGAEQEDQMRKLREDMERREAEGREVDESPKKKKEKKRKKEKKSKDDSEGDKKKAKKVEETEEDEIPGQKSGKALYAETGLDPSRKPRNKILRRAKRFGQSSKKKKKKKGSDKDSDSTTSSSSNEDPLLTGGLFESDRKIKVIADRCPGAPGYSVMLEVRQNLLTAAGTSWAVEKQAEAPVFAQYTQQQMASSLSPAMLQEVMTVATCLDLLLLNRPAAAVDILGQRFKDWTVSRQIELVRSDNMTSTQEVESLEAARRAREQEKPRNLVTKAVENRGDHGQGGKKQKWQRLERRRKGEDWWESKRERRWWEARR